MREERALVRDRNDVVMKSARRDCLFGLLDEKGSRRIEAVRARDRLACLAVLAGGERAAADPVHKNLDAWAGVIGAQPHVVGRALVPERRRNG